MGYGSAAGKKAQRLFDVRQSHPLKPRNRTSTGIPVREK
jgi:hypothetical protein